MKCVPHATVRPVARSLFNKATHLKAISALS